MMFPADPVIRRCPRGTEKELEPVLGQIHIHDESEAKSRQLSPQRAKDLQGLEELEKENETRSKMARLDMLEQ